MNNRQQTSNMVAESRPAERRIKRRTQLHLKADVTLPGDLTIVGHTVDISASGLSIDVPYQLEPGQHCEIELNFSRMGGPAWVQLSGEVRRCVEVDEGRFQAGLQFVDLDPKLVELLDQYIWSKLEA